MRFNGRSLKILMVISSNITLNFTYFVANKFNTILKYLNYILILIGAVIAIYAKVGANQNQYILISGIIVLMIGVYRIAKTIPSKNDEQNNNDLH